MDNLSIREFSQAIINFINQSPLAVEIKRLCINDIAGQLQSAADKQVQIEILERDNKRKDEKEEKHEPMEEDPSEYPMEK